MSDAPSPPSTPSPPPERRPWDVALTVGLIALGAFNVVGSFAAIADFGSTFDTVYATVGIDGRFQDTDTATTVGFAVNVVWVAALLWSAVVAIGRLRAGRIAFWVPLVAGAVTMLVYTVAAGVLIAGDPVFQEYVANLASTGGSAP